MNRTGIVIVGGGVYAAKLAEGLARRLSRASVDLNLVARRFERLQVIARHAARRVEAVRPTWRLRAYRVPSDALPGAALVVLLFRVGGLGARAHDESFPAFGGLVGDEGIGVGGMANAWRTVPVLEEMAQELRRHAPGARVVNMVAPLGITTRLLLDEGLDAVGICELPLVTRERLIGSGSGKGGLAYAGLNHLGWFWAVGEAGERALATGVEKGRVDREVLEEFGAAPLHYYYDVFDPAAGRRLGRVRRPGRAEELAVLDAEIFDRLRRNPGAEVSAFEQRPTPWFDRALIPVIFALTTDSGFASFANVRNGCLVPDVPATGVVEVEAEVSIGGVRALAPGPVPGPVSRFLRAVGESEAMTYRAARERDPSRLIDAIRALPLPISERHVPGLVKEISTDLEGPTA
jgi:6-phospho-beta-glucosidase